MKTFTSYLRSIAAVLLLLSSVLLLAGCEKETVAATDLVIITLNGQNMPASAPDRTEDLILDTASVDGSSVSILCADGDPWLCGAPIEFGERRSKNEYHWQKELSERCEQVAQSLEESRAKAKETDLIGAIQLGARQLQAGTSEKKEMVIFHSGINTCLPFEMQNYALGALDVDDIINQLREQNYLSSLNGVDIHWYFLGDVDGEQPALAADQIEMLRLFWDSYLEESGASSVTFHSDLPATSEVEDAPEVSTIEVTAAKPEPVEPVSLDSDIIFFEPDSTEIANKEAARQQLTQIVEAIKRVPETKYVLAGSTADVDGVTMEYAQNFGLERANSVRDLLCEMGVPADQLECIGLGQAKTTVRDHIDQSANRTVWLVPSEDPLADEFRSLGISEQS